MKKKKEIKTKTTEEELLVYIDTLITIIGSYAHLLNVSAKNSNLFHAEAQERNYYTAIRDIAEFMNENHGRNIQLMKASDEDNDK